MSTCSSLWQGLPAVLQRCSCGQTASAVQSVLLPIATCFQSQLQQLDQCGSTSTQISSRHDHRQRRLHVTANSQTTCNSQQEFNAQQGANSIDPQQSYQLTCLSDGTTHNYSRSEQPGVSQQTHYFRLPALNRLQPLQPSILANLSCSRHFHSSCTLQQQNQQETDQLTQALTQLYAQASNCENVEQLNALAADTIHLWDVRLLQAAMDIIIRGLSTARQSPEFLTLLTKLGSLYTRLLPGLGTVDAIRCLHSFGMIKFNPGGDEQGLMALCEHFREERFQQLVESQNHTEVVNLLWALASISNHGELTIDTTMFNAAEPLIRQYTHVMALPVLAKVAFAYGEAKESHGPVLETIQEEVARRLMRRYDDDVMPLAARSTHGFNAPAVTNIMKALSQHAKTISPSLSLMKEVADHVIMHTPDLKLNHKITLAKALAVLQYGKDDLDQSQDKVRFWTTVSEQAVRNAARLSPQQLQDLAYAWARRSLEDRALFSALANRGAYLLKQSPESVKPANVSILLWGFARHVKLENYGEFIKEACKYISKHYTEFTVQNLANSVWSLAQLEHEDAKLLKTLADHVKSLLQDPEGRAKLQKNPESGVETYVMPGCDLVERWTQDGQVLEKYHYKSGNVAVRALPKGVSKPQFNSQNLTDLLLAFTRFDYKDEQLYQLLVERCVEHIPSYSLLSVVDFCWSLTRLGVKNNDALQKLERHIDKTNWLQALGPTYLSEILLTFAKLEYTLDKEFLKKVMDIALLKWANLKPEEPEIKHRLVWSFIQLGCLDRFPSHALNNRIQDEIVLHHAQAKYRAEQAASNEQPAAAENTQ